MNKSVNIIMATILIVPVIILADKNDISLEDKTKAAFIYNFTRYIEWPEDTVPTFTIAVFGDSKILAPLREIGKKKLVGKKKIRIIHYQDISKIDTCHMLFVSGSEKDKLEEILLTSRNKNILTLSDTKGFAQKGVALNFRVVKEKLRFEINSEALDGLNVHVSSQLLKLALFVKGKKKHE